MTTVAVTVAVTAIVMVTLIAATVTVIITIPIAIAMATPTPILTTTTLTLTPTTPMMTTTVVTTSKYPLVANSLKSQKKGRRARKRKEVMESGGGGGSGTSTSTMTTTMMVIITIADEHSLTSNGMIIATRSIGGVMAASPTTTITMKNIFLARRVTPILKAKRKVRLKLKAGLTVSLRPKVRLKPKADPTASLKVRARVCRDDATKHACMWCMTASALFLSTYLQLPQVSSPANQVYPSLSSLPPSLPAQWLSWPSPPLSPSTVDRVIRRDFL